jgi:hypothetical protein
MTEKEFLIWLKETLEINAIVDWSLVDAADEFNAILITLNEIKYENTKPINI